MLTLQLSSLEIWAKQKFSSYVAKAKRKKSLTQKKINKISFSSVVALLAPNQQERTLNYPPIIKT